MPLSTRKAGAAGLHRRVRGVGVSRYRPAAALGRLGWPRRGGSVQTSLCGFSGKGMNRPSQPHLSDRTVSPPICLAGYPHEQPETPRLPPGPRRYPGGSHYPRHGRDRSTGARSIGVGPRWAGSIPSRPDAAGLCASHRGGRRGVRRLLGHAPGGAVERRNPRPSRAGVLDKTFRRRGTWGGPSDAGPGELSDPRKPPAGRRGPTPGRPARSPPEPGARPRSDAPETGQYRPCPRPVQAPGAPVCAQQYPGRTVRRSNRWATPPGEVVP